VDISCSGRRYLCLAHAPLGQPAIYARTNTAVPLGPAVNYVGQNDSDPLTFILYPSEGNGKAMLYEDEGDDYEHLNGVYARRTITCEVEEGSIRVVLGEQEGTFVPTRRRIRLELREIASEPEAVQVGETSATWWYDPERRRLILDLSEAPTSRLIDLLWQRRGGR
jgi:alpha-glucosidase